MILPISMCTIAVLPYFVMHIIFCQPNMKMLWLNIFKFFLTLRDVPIGGHCAPNILKFAWKLVKSQPCCKRVHHSIFCDLFYFLSNNSWPISQNAPPTNRRYLSTSLAILYHSKVLYPPLVVNITFFTSNLYALFTIFTYSYNFIICLQNITQ